MGEDAVKYLSDQPILADVAKNDIEDRVREAAKKDYKSLKKSSLYAAKMIFVLIKIFAKSTETRIIRRAS